jgi:hypothetical protein
LVCHAVVKRAYVELRERVAYLKRLAFWTIRAEEAAEASELFHLTGSKAADIDVVMTVDADLRHPQTPQSMDQRHSRYGLLPWFRQCPPESPALAYG